MKSKVTYYCTECGNESPKWQGRCSACGAWNTLKEHVEQAQNPASIIRAGMRSHSRPKQLSEIVGSDEIRFSCGMKELDRVLGGGGVRGSLVLVGGAPRHWKVYASLADLQRALSFPAGSLCLW